MKGMNTDMKNGKVINNVSIIILGIILTVFYFILLKWLHNSIEAINSSVIFLTLLILIWYTYETRNIHLTTKRQVELQFKPILAIELIEEPDLALNIINVGNGPAFNIEIPNVPLGFDSGIYFKFDSISSLRAGDSKQVKVKNFRGDEEVNFPFDAHLRPNYASNEVKIKIQYNDTEMNDIEQNFELGTGKLRIYINH